ncbi:transcriptional regulatory protein [Ferroplasma acidiphilum]|uniref:Transcriptional regulatory protein n=2 Tax=Ferroplasma acidiphilum TaxID=74969 RepID=A0A1V0N2J3_9ARCH|nr:transcriptional regulatory protein [Ferroplasma acidiphilum]
MHSNMNRNESRVLKLLFENSKMPISEISDRLLLNRNTVSKIITKLNREYIERYTITLKERENSLYIIAEMENIDGLDDDIIEYYKMANGNYLVVMNKDSLSGNLQYKNLNIAYKRVLNNDMEKVDLYCDYCDSIISGKPHVLDVNHNKLYFCCDTCKSEYIQNHNATI